MLIQGYVFRNLYPKTILQVRIKGLFRYPLKQKSIVQKATAYPYIRKKNTSNPPETLTPRLRRNELYKKVEK